MSNATAQITGTIVQVDPTDLVIDDNVLRPGSGGGADIPKGWGACRS